MVRLIQIFVATFCVFIASNINIVKANDGLSLLNSLQLQWVNDFTNTLSVETNRILNQKLQTLNDTKGAQLGVVIVKSTDDETIESFADQVFQTWKLGRSGIDDGVLLVIAKDDRKLRIEVGYGLEGAIPDILAGRIIREQIAPRFAENDFDGGVLAGVDSILLLIDGEELPEPDIDDDEWLEELPFIAIMMVFAAILPTAVGVLVVSVFAGLVFESIKVALIALVIAVIIRVIAVLLGVKKHVKWQSNGTRGGFGGGSGGMGGGSSGSGSGGGGGSSGGGGASGGW